MKKQAPSALLRLDQRRREILTALSIFEEAGQMMNKKEAGELLIRHPDLRRAMAAADLSLARLRQLARHMTDEEGERILRNHAHALEKAREVLAGRRTLR
jgi:hypothetical protein